MNEDTKNNVEEGKVRVSVEREREVRTYSELWHASSCVLERGQKETKGSSWQFLSSILLTAFAFEAYLNHVGKQISPCWNCFDRLSPKEKYSALSKQLQLPKEVTWGREPLQTVNKLIGFRHALAHGKTQRIEEGPLQCSAEEYDAILSRRLEVEWEQLIQTCDFAEKVRAAVEEALIPLHAARPEPKEHLFSFGFGLHSARVLDQKMP